MRYGILSPTSLLEKGKEYGYACLLLTDINSTSGCLDFVRLGPRYGIRPLVGIDFREGVQQKFIGIAKSNQGYFELNQYLSSLLHKKLETPDRAPQLPDTFMVYPLQVYAGQELRENEYIGVRTQDVPLLHTRMRELPKERLVVIAGATFRHKMDFNTHRLLRAIGENTLLSKLSKDKHAEEGDIWPTMEELPKTMGALSTSIGNTTRLYEQCSIEFQFGQDAVNQNLQTFTGSEEQDFALLKKLCNEGMEYRYPQPSKEILARLDKELTTIQTMGFVSYFLINWEILRYARERGYYYVGRGSGANSIVAYLLRITDVDPVDLDLYFERFINLYRKNPPDFDIDFSWLDRDDVISYIFQRFQHTALLATYNTFQYKAAVRELGKVYGLPKSEIDLLATGKADPEQLDANSQQLLRYAERIKDLPNHLSIHAGGILIAQRPIQCFAATFMPPKGLPTTQFDMVIAEDVGLYKFDILSQRGLSKIKEALHIINYNRPTDTPVDIHDIQRFKEDSEVKRLLKTAKAIGCFYVESPAMRMLLKKLEADDYLGLVTASSIIRPGVAKSGMMREYILRFRNPERRKDAHPVMLELMPDTFGVMVYQEDVIKVAHYFGGLTLGEADMLRRGMSGKFRSREEFEKVKGQFFSNCLDKGYPLAVVQEIWRQIESFAGYAFSKGHSASYAVESFQSLFLKAHYPLEYMVATINNYGGFYRTELYVHEARLHGGIIHAPCVNRSQHETYIYDKDIYLGFHLISSLEMTTAKALLAERENGEFQSFDDFINRVKISVEQITLLIRIDAFRFTGEDKMKLLWEAHFKISGKEKNEALIMANLFRPSIRQYEIPQLERESHEDALDQMELLGFPLASPFDLLADPPQNKIVVADFAQYLGQVIETTGYLVSIKNTRTTQGATMHFGTFLDEKGAFLDTVHFPPSASKYPFRGTGVYRIRGKVVEEFGFYSLEVDRMHRLTYKTVQDE